MDWQEYAALAIVFLTAVVMALSVWRARRRKRGAGGCCCECPAMAPGRSSPQVRYRAGSAEPPKPAR